MSLPLLRIGVMGCAHIARRSMVPALIESGSCRLVVIASRTLERARECAGHFGCEALAGYGALLARNDIDAVYMPLPTGLHEIWGPRVLEAGKHLLVEKSLASSLEGATQILGAARANRLLVVENFLFPRHSQHSWVERQLNEDAVGRLYLLRASFAFPPRPPKDIRYRRDLGGGALLDAGAYVLKAAELFLGRELKVSSAILDYDSETGVDLCGHAMLVNPQGQVAQVSFGFDSFYQCHYELLGSKGKLVVERAYTPPPGFVPSIRLETQNRVWRPELEPDDHYVKQWQFFAKAVNDPACWEGIHAELMRQATLIDAVRHLNPWP